MALRSLLKSVLNQNSSTIHSLVCDNCCALFCKQTRPPRWCCISAIAAPKWLSEIAPAFRMMDQNEGKTRTKIRMFNWCLMCNQMANFSYPACTKRGGLSSLDQNRSPVVPPPLAVSGNAHLHITVVYIAVCVIDIQKLQTLVHRLLHGEKTWEPLHTVCEHIKFVCYICNLHHCKNKVVVLTTAWLP